MTRYIVQWEIDLEADTPLEAARQAFVIQRDAQSIATVFNVLDDEHNLVERVDLLPL